MTRLQWGFAGVWTALICAMAFALSSGVGAGTVELPDGAHVAAHLVLFGVLAAAVGWRRRADVTLLGVMLAGALVELVQMAAAGRWLLREATYDLGVDALAAMAGLALLNRKDVAQWIGVWLHPALVLPVGLVGVFYASERDLGNALGWTALAVACLAPSGALWVYGTQRGWWSDLDLVDRRERPLLFTIACLSAVSFACAVRAAEASAGVVGVADAVLVLSVALTAVTLLGFKMSGHVAVSLLLAVAIAPWSDRGPMLFVGSAVLLSWARVRAEVHRPLEVAGAWALGAALLATW